MYVNVFTGSPSCRALGEDRVRFVLSVEEGRRSERSLRQLRASDADAGPNGRVQFRLESETAFRIAFRSANSEPYYWKLHKYLRALKT